LPNGTKGIPNWFEHQSRGQSISFWFRKNIPSITSILIIPETLDIEEINLFVNGYKCTLSESLFYYSNFLPSEHAFLFDLKLEEQIKFMFEMDKALLKNQWIHVKLEIEDEFSDTKEKDFREDQIQILRSVQMGIHVLKEKSNTEENVIFTNPHRKYSNTSLLQFEPSLKKQRLVDVGVSETENLHQQHLAALLTGMRNLVLTETKEKLHRG